MAIYNVGITEEQKMKMEKILHQKMGKYKSVNNIVQTAVDILITKEAESKTTKNGEEVFSTLKEFEVLLDNLLENELEGKTKLDKNVLSSIDHVSAGLKKLKSHIIHGSDKRNILLIAINLRDRLNILLSNLKDEEEYDDGNIEDIINEIEKLKIKLIKEIKSIKR